MKSTVDKLAANPLQVAIGLALLLGVVYLLVRKSLGAAVDAAGGVLSGNNALTEGTAYQGDGLAGTLGAGADALTGGLLGDFGGFLGSATADVTDSLQAFFGTAPAGSDVYYTVNFPDGLRHAVAADSVKDGQFTYGATVYRLYVDGAGMKYARTT